MTACTCPSRGEAPHSLDCPASDDRSATVIKFPCPTCTGPTRETVGMVCQTCGTDYAASPTGDPA